MTGNSYQEKGLRALFSSLSSVHCFAVVLSSRDRSISIRFTGLSRTLQASPNLTTMAVVFHRPGNQQTQQVVMRGHTLCRDTELYWLEVLAHTRWPALRSHQLQVIDPGVAPHS